VGLQKAHKKRKKKKKKMIKRTRDHAIEAGVDRIQDYFRAEKLGIRHATVSGLRQEVVDMLFAIIKGLSRANKMTEE
jgi:hypothetical protein